MALEYRSSYKQRRKYIFFPLLKMVSVIVIFTVIAMGWFKTHNEDVLFVVGLTWLYIGVIHIVPLLIIGFHHNQLSANTYFSVDTIKNTFQYKAKDITLLFHLSDIAKVIRVVSPPTYDKRIDLLGFGRFFYWKIIFVDGRTLSMSCMLLDIDEFFGKKLVQEKQLFPIPPSNV